MSDDDGTVIHKRNGMHLVPISEDGFDAEVSTAVATFRVGGREVPWFSEPRCKTCNSKYRVEIERAIGWKRESAASIVRRLPEDSEITVDNIYKHVQRGHLVFVDQMQTTVLLARAMEMGQAVEEDAQILHDQITANRMIVGMGVEDMLKNKMRPTITEVIAASKFLQAVEDQGGGDEGELDNVSQVFLTYWRAIQKHASPEAMRAIAEDVRNDPVLRALVQKTMREDATETQSRTAEGVDA